MTRCAVTNPRASTKHRILPIHAQGQQHEATRSCSESLFDAHLVKSRFTVHQLRSSHLRLGVAREEPDAEARHAALLTIDQTGRHSRRSLSAGATYGTAARYFSKSSRRPALASRRRKSMVNTTANFSPAALARNWLTE